MYLGHWDTDQSGMGGLRMAGQVGGEVMFLKRLVAVKKGWASWGP